jgi:hypothetical protein
VWRWFLGGWPTLLPLVTRCPWISQRTSWRMGVRMKVVVLLLTALLGGTTDAVGQSSGALPDGIHIQSFDFRAVFKEGEQEKLSAPPYSANPRPYESPSSMPGGDATWRNPLPQERHGFEVYLQLKNSGSRAIKKLDWDFLFLDSKSDRELKRFTINSRNRIAPGEVRFLTKQVLPGLFLGNKTKPDFASGKSAVVIRSIEFADGSKWQGALRKP